MAMVRVQGNVLVPEEEILARLEVAPGVKISPDELERRVERTDEWGGYGRLTHDSARREDGLHVTITLRERVVLESLEIRGNRRLSDGQLRRVSSLEKGMQLDAELIDRAKERILSLYREEGYNLAFVETAGRFHEDGSFTLVLDIAEGRDLRVKRINFSGNEAFSRNRLRRIMDTHVHLRLPFIRKGRFDPEVFNEDLENIEHAYYSRGYLDAQAGGYWTYTDGFDGYELNVAIYEGPRYRLSDEIVIEGNRLFTDEELISEAELRPGRFYTPGTPGEAGRAISRLYSTQGLVDVTVERGNLKVEPVYRAEEGLVDLHISIEETETVYVRGIKVEGLTKTDEIVVLRHLRFEPGDRVDTSAFRASERALVDTGYFDLTHPDPVQISLAPGDERFRDVIVNVREGPTGSLMMGGGFSSRGGFMANLSVTERNFDIGNWPGSWGDFREGAPLRGAGQELSLRLDVGTEQSDFELAFREPRIRHTEYSFGARAYSRLNSWKLFDLVRAGTGVSLGRRLGEHVRQQVEFGYEHMHVRRMDRDAPEEIARDEGTFQKPYVDVSLRRDTRDSTMFPTKGYDARVGTEFSMLDVQKAELTAEFTRYWPVYEHSEGRKHVFMLRGDSGIMRPIGTKDRIPVFERFYGGGMGSVRGFEWWGISPVDDEQQEQLGGRSKLSGTAEYTVPLFTDHFRVAVFADAGYVEERARDVFSGWDKLRVSTGAGLRFFMPAMGGIPITIDFAVPLEREDYDKTRNLHFHMGLGHAF